MARKPPSRVPRRSQRRSHYSPFGPILRIIRQSRTQVRSSGFRGKESKQRRPTAGLPAVCFRRSCCMMVAGASKRRKITVRGWLIGSFSRFFWGFRGSPGCFFRETAVKSHRPDSGGSENGNGCQGGTAEFPPSAMRRVACRAFSDSLENGRT